MSPKKPISPPYPPTRGGVLGNHGRTERKTLPPLFLTMELRRAIERLLPAGHHQRMRSYFDTHGCIRCSHNDVIYGGNGFCHLCLRMIEKRMRKIDKHLENRISEPPPDLKEAYLRPYTSARQLLADLVPKMDKRTTQKKAEPKHPPKIYLEWLT
jgi:hypothetical protein